MIYDMNLLNFDNMLSFSVSQNLCTFVSTTVREFLHEIIYTKAYKRHMYHVYNRKMFIFRLPTESVREC